MARKLLLSQPVAGLPAIDLDAVLALRERSFRNQTGCFFADGARFVISAAESHADIRHLVVSPSLLRSSAARHCARRLGANGVPLINVSEADYTRISLAEEPQGIGAVIGQRWDRLIEQNPGPRDLWIALDSIRNPGNLGTILRTAEAVGARGVMLIGGEADPYDPGSVRASMGAIFRQRLVRTSARALLGWKSRRDCMFVGATPDGSVDYRSVSYRRPVVLVLGSERQGLRPRQVGLCDRLVRIPMVGSGDSLNLAVAAGVLMYEVFAQRQGTGSGGWG